MKRGMAEEEVLFETRGEVCKVSDELGLVFGWGVVCSKNGEDYYDLQGDNIPQDAMLDAAADFMIHSRVAGDMHKQADGRVVFMFPMIDEVAKAFSIECPTRGLLVGVKPSADVLGKFKSGEYTGFSIGGRRIDEEVVED